MSKTLLSLIKPRHNPKPISSLKPHLRRLINKTIEILTTQNTQWEESLEAGFLEAEIMASDVAHYVFDRMPHPELGLKFYHWVSDHKPYHGSLDGDAYSSLLKLLARSREFLAIVSVLDTMRKEEILPNRDALGFMIRSYADFGSLDEALKLYCFVQKAHHCLPDVRACNSLLSALVNDGKLEVALKMFVEMLEGDDEENNECCVDNYSVSIIVRGLCKEGKIDEGRKMIEDRWGQGCIPNIIFYNTLIDGYVKRGNLEEASKLSKELKIRGFLPTLETYGSLISGFCKAGNFDVVDGLIAEMKLRGFHINVNIYNSLVDSQCKHGFEVKPAETIERMTKQGCQPDIVTYNTLIAASCKDGKIEEAEGLLKQALQRGLVANRLTYTPLIYALGRKGQYEQMQQLLLEMMDQGQMPDLVTYGALVHGLVANGEVDDAVKVKNKMIEKGVFPDAQVYNVLMNGLCKKMRLDSAKDLLAEMQNRNLAPDQYTYTTLIDGCIKNGKLDEAKILFESSISRSESSDGPGVVGYNAMIKGYCKFGMMKDAISCFHRMVKRNLAPDKFTYSTIIDGFGKQNDLNNALVMFREMLRQKLKPNVVILTSLIDGFCRGGNSVRAESLFRGMESFDLEPNVVTYSILIRGFCKEEKLAKSAVIFEEMLRKRCSPNDITYNYLINGFSNCELSNESQEEKSLFLKMFREMVRDGWARASAVYNSILACLGHHGMVKDALLLRDKMLKKGYAPDPVAFTALLNGICLEQGGKDWKSVLPYNLNQGKLKIALKYSLILDDCLHHGQISEATVILQNLVENYDCPYAEVQWSPDE